MIMVFFSEAGLKVKLNNELNDTIRKKHQKARCTNVGIMVPGIILKDLFF